MKIIFKHILKNIWEKKARSLLIIFSLIIATTVFVLNLTIPDEIALKHQETLRSVFGNADIRLGNEDAFSMDSITTSEEKFKYICLTSKDVFFGDIQVQIFGVEIKDAKYMNMLGEDVPDLKKNEIVISAKQAEKHSFEKGDVVTAEVNDKNVEFKIVEVVNKKGFTALESEYPIFIANIDTINELTENFDKKYNQIYIDVEKDEKVKEFAEHLRKNNANYQVEELVDAESIKEALSFVSYIMILIFALATIMIFFVVGSLNKIIITERMPVIGTFRSIGATRGKMNLILILENVVYGLIGGTIGTFLGFAVNGTAASLFITTNGVKLSNKSAQINFGTLFIGIMFAVLLEFFISIKAIIKANKKPIKDIIFDTQNTRYKISKIKTIIGFIMIILSLILNALNQSKNIVLTILSIVMLIVATANVVPFIMRGLSKLLATISKKINFATGIIACKNIGYNKMIISSSRLIVVSISLIIAILTVSSSFSELFNSFRYTVDNYDIVIQNVTQTAKEYDELQKMDSVENVGYMYCFWDERTTYNEGKKFNTVPTILGQAESCKYIVELDYKIEDLKYNELLIDEKLAEKNNIKVGDVLKINFESHNINSEFKVKGLINSTYFTTSRNVILVNLEYFFDNVTKIPMQVHVNANDNTDLLKLKTDIKKSLKEIGIEIRTVEEYLEEQESQVSSIMGLFYVIIGLAVFLSFIGIINNQIISFIQRRKEIAVLNSTCMSKKQLKHMLIIETVLSNLLSCITAICIAFLTTRMIDSFLQGMILYIDVAFNWSLAFEFSGIMFVLLLLTLFIPIKRLKKLNIVNEIKYE